jgi:hypothetical protein
MTKIKDRSIQCEKEREEMLPLPSQCLFITVCKTQSQKNPLH